MIRVLTLSLALMLAPLATAAQEQPVFKDYDEMRSILDTLMMTRQVGDVMRRFGGSDEMSDEDIDALDARLRNLFPYDFKHVDLLRVDQMENGWSQEMYAYWSGLSYVFVVVLLHQRDDSLVAINIKFNTDFYELIKSF